MESDLLVNPSDQVIERGLVVRGPTVQVNINWISMRLRVRCSGRRLTKGSGRDPRRLAQLDSVVKLKPLMTTLAGWHRPLMHNLTTYDQLHGLNRCNFTGHADSNLHP